VLLRLALAATVAIGLAQATDTQSRTIALPAARRLTLETTVGNVRILGAPRSEARLEIVRKAPSREGLARIPIVIDETADETRISVAQLEGRTEPELFTEVTLHVPHEARLASIRLFEGRLTLANLRGVVSADVRRGSIAVTDSEGTLRLETGLGDIVADRMRLAPGGLLRLRTFNGDVRLTLAERPRDARVMALALNGTISSSIPLTMKDTWGPRWGEATLGKGEPVISIDVITGAIQIKAP
jgi:DUF4097 and DUF4098 domain-containing protein YvlB